MQSNRQILCSGFALILLLLAVTVQAQQPTSQVITFNGTIPTQPDGPVALRFRLYNVDTGGTILFEETQTVTVTAEKFTVRIGDATVGGIPALMFRNNPSLWIAFALDVTPDTEIGSRTAITSSGYAHSAQSLSGPVVTSINTLSGDVTLAGSPHITITPAESTLTFDVAGVLTGVAHDSTLSGDGAGAPLGVAAGGVTTPQLADGAVTAPKIATPLSLTSSTPGTTFSASNSTSSIGVSGSSNSATGVQGVSTSGTGVAGFSTSFTGVQGLSTSGTGVAGFSTSSNGVSGSSDSGFGVYSAGKLAVTVLDAGTQPLCRNTSTSAIGTCPSSLRYKTDVQPFLGGLEIVNRLRPIAFTWKQGGMRGIGLAAEDVEKVEPLLTFRNDKGEIEGVRYNELSAVFVNAFAEQQAQIQKQQEQITKQQGEIEALKKLVCLSQPNAEVCK